MTSDSFKNFVNNENSKKPIFTPGPSSLLAENILGLKPCFGRGDINYKNIEDNVLDSIKSLAGQKNIVRMQGSASLAIEVSIKNFISGRVLLIDSGYYSDRIKCILNNEKEIDNHLRIDYVNYFDLDNLKDFTYDWVVACYVETSKGFRHSLSKIKKFVDKAGAKLFLDATASIGLEENHHLADLLAFSSCKGLFGLTGACFITFNDLKNKPINSFYLDIRTHLEKKMTGPYHQICSLDLVLKNYNFYKKAVINTKVNFMKRFSDFTIYPLENQPYLCTFVNKKIITNNENVVLYSSRANTSGSIVCHLGEVHLGDAANGKINELIEIGE